MNLGTLYGIGVGPGDPELITVKAARILAAAGHVAVPKPRTGAESLALRIARSYLRKEAEIHTLIFPMTSDAKELTRHWDEAGSAVEVILRSGQDVCFLTLGDPLLYSTYIYLLRALRRKIPKLYCHTVPGVIAASAVAARTNFPIGEAKNNVTIIPTADDLSAVTSALDRPGTVVLMKIGDRLDGILKTLAERDLLQHGVLVSRAGQAGERIETDLSRLQGAASDIGYLATMLVQVSPEKNR